MEALRRIGFSCDWHCGSRWGLTPPKYLTKFSPKRVGWLWETWLEYWDQAPRFDLLFLDGDLIDGTQYRSEGTSCLTTNLGEQVEIAMECFESIPKAKRPKAVVRLVGTPYHESFHGPLKAFDEAFGVWQPQIPEQAMVVDLKLPDGQNLNVKHEPEGSPALYLGTVQDRELLWARVSEACHALHESTFVVRAHLHFDGCHRAFGKLLINLPCWCLQMPYAIRKRYWRWQPGIGGVSLTRSEKDDFGWRENFWVRKVPPLEQQSYDSITEKDLERK